MCQYYIKVNVTGLADELVSVGTQTSVEETQTSKRKTSPCEIHLV